MSYTKAQIAAIGKELESASGGLIPAPVGAAWASAEQGINNNVFGLGASHAGVPAYASTTAAVQATWHQMTSSGVYAATISRLQAAGGNVGKAALAIAESPWHLGAAGVKAAGGVDPYYARVFTQAGIPVGIASPGSGGGPWTPPAPSAPAAGSSTVTQDTLTGLGIDATGGHMLTDADIWKITMKATGQDPNKAINAGNSIYQGYLTNLRGKTVAQMSSDYSAGTTYQAPDPVTAVANAIGAIPGQLTALVIPGVVLIALLWIGKVGLQKTLG